MIEEDGPLADAEKFTLTYKLKEDTYELYDEQQILYLHMQCTCVMSGECDICVEGLGCDVWSE